MRETFLVFGQPLIEQAEMDEVLDSMRAAWLGTGPKVHRFEKDFASYKDVPAAVALNSCTAGLHMAFSALQLQPGDEVITTAMTFCATVNTIIHAGGTPVLADIDPTTLCIDPDSIEAHITSRTRAIAVVHFAGRPCNMDAIMALAERYHLAVVEDCAHAIETEYHGRKAGTIGDVGCFSFYSTKNVVTGEGGMVIAKDQAILDRIRIMSLHGMSADAWSRFSDKGYRHYQVVDLGFKYNMMDIQAAIGIHQLRRVELNWQRRRELWERYLVAFADLPLLLPAPVEADTRHAFHLFTIGVDRALCGIERDAMLMELHNRNIGSGVHYLSIPEHPFYRERFGWNPADTPKAVAWGRKTLSLPIGPKLADSDADDVIEAVRDSILGHRV